MIRYLIYHGRRTAQERVTGGRWRRIVLVDVLAEHILELRDTSWPSGFNSRLRFLATVDLRAWARTRMGDWPAWLTAADPRRQNLVS